MRKIFLFLSLLSCIKLTAQESFNFEYNLNDFFVKSNNNVISIVPKYGEWRGFGDDTYPAFPYETFRIIIPCPDENTNYTIVFSDTIIFSDVEMMANPIAEARRGRNDEPPIKKALSSITKPIIDCGVFTRKGIKYKLFKITPFLYDAVEKKLSFVHNISLTPPIFEKKRT